MEFEQYLEEALKKPTHESYNPDGNSARAIVVRGFWREVLWQCKVFPKRLKYALSEFDGGQTPIIWFFGIPLMAILSPVLPVAAAFHWYRKSVAEYRREYEAKRT